MLVYLSILAHRHGGRSSNLKYDTGTKFGVCCEAVGLAIAAVFLSLWGVGAIVVYVFYRYVMRLCVVFVWVCISNRLMLNFTLLANRNKPCKHDLAVWSLVQGIVALVSANWQLYATYTHKPAHLHR